MPLVEQALVFHGLLSRHSRRESFWFRSNFTLSWKDFLREWHERRRSRDTRRQTKLYTEPFSLVNEVNRILLQTPATEQVDEDIENLFFSTA